MIAVHSMPGTHLNDTPLQPSLSSAPVPFANVKYTPLHPTFGAEVTGFDFDNMTEAKVEEMKRALAIVRLPARSVSAG